MKYWIVCLAVLAGATWALPQRSEKEAQSRNIAILQSYPSVVQCEFYLFWSTIDWSKQCAGSILTPTVVLSAASCFSGWSYESRFRRIRAGSASRSTGGIVLYVDRRINNPGWGTTGYSHDIAVVRLRSPMVYGPVIQPAAIASPGSFLPTNLRLSQPAWGRKQQPLITHLPITTAPRANCGRQDGTFSSAFNATVNIICGLTNGTSNDDVGGPWIFDRVTVGVVGGVNSLDVYSGLIGTEVSAYTQWIVETVASGF